MYIFYSSQTHTQLKTLRSSIDQPLLAYTLHFSRIENTLNYLIICQCLYVIGDWGSFLVNTAHFEEFVCKAL